jgi:serine/threonine-protein kinase
MTHKSATCATCDPRQIERLLRDELDAAEQQALEVHLSECRHCRGELERAAADGETWQAALAFLSDSAEENSDGCGVAEDGVPAESVELEAVLAALAPTDDPRMLGRLGSYEIVGVIGRGGMGIVLKGFDAALNRYVAIKVLAPHLASSGAARQRFAREARAAATVVHDNVVAIHSVDASGRLPYFVMPYIRGCSLQKRIDRDGPLPLADTLRVAMQVASGLAAAHAQGLVHRDIKPANILLEEGVERLAITDFGLARAADDASLTRTGVIAGTPQYMSPEQACGEAVDERSDLFSLGSVIYAMCAGRPPFRAETSYGVLRRIGEGEPRPLREVNPQTPDWLARLVDKLHRKDPADRFPTAEEVARLLAQCLVHVQQPDASPLPAALQAPETKPRSNAQGKRAKLLIAAGAIACVAAVVLPALAPLLLPPETRQSPPSGGADTANAANQKGGEAGEPSTADADWDGGVSQHIAALRDDVEALEANGAAFWSNAPADAAEAIEVFWSQAQELGFKRPDNVDFIARREPFSKAFGRVDDTLTAAERRHAIQYGALDDLRRAGDCWAIGPQGPSGPYGGSSLIGYLDTETGLLVFVWIAPEG